MIVLDSSAALDYLLGAEPLATWVEGQLDAARWNLHAPHAIDLEVFAVVRARVVSGTMSARRGRAALDSHADLPLRRYPLLQLVDRMWSLRDHVSSRDASFVALAEALDVPLVTTDLRLSRAHGLRVPVITPAH